MESYKLSCLWWRHSRTEMELTKNEGRIVIAYFRSNPLRLDRKYAMSTIRKRTLLSCLLGFELAFGLERMINDPDNKPELNQFQRDISAKWPFGIVQYYVNITCLDYITGHRIRMTMNMLETVSCLKFEPILFIPDENNQSSPWIHITNLFNLLVLGFDCLSTTQILHSLLHAIGFADEVTHPMRDLYIRVLWQNIQPDYRYLYNINPEPKPALMVEYDPLSVMHFHDHDFTINGQATVEPLAGGLVINPSDELSQLDILKLSLYFGHICKTRNANTILNACKKKLNNKERAKGFVPNNSGGNDSGDLQGRIEVGQPLFQYEKVDQADRDDGDNFYDDDDDTGDDEDQYDRDDDDDDGDYDEDHGMDSDENDEDISMDSIADSDGINDIGENK